MDTGLKLTHLKELVDIGIKNSYHNWISYFQKARGKTELRHRRYLKKTRVEITEIKTRLR